LPKETNQRKGTLPLVPPQAGYPVLLDAAGALQTRGVYAPYGVLKQCKALFRQPLRCSAAWPWGNYRSGLRHSNALDYRFRC